MNYEHFAFITDFLYIRPRKMIFVTFSILTASKMTNRSGFKRKHSSSESESDTASPPTSRSTASPPASRSTASPPASRSTASPRASRSTASRRASRSTASTSGPARQAGPTGDAGLPPCGGRVRIKFRKDVFVITKLPDNKLTFYSSLFSIYNNDKDLLSKMIDKKVIPLYITDSLAALDALAQKEDIFKYFKKTHR
nr:unnamed protein product [Callosobruchus chinensis]